MAEERDLFDNASGFVSQGDSFDDNFQTPEPGVYAAE